MKFYTYFFSLFRKNRLRYIACILGFSMALGSVFTITSYTNMMDRMLNQFFLVDSDSLMVVSKGTSMAQFIPFSSKISEDIQDDISEIYGVQSIVPMIFKDFSNFSTSDWIKDVILGVDFSYLSLIYFGNDELQSGRLPAIGVNEILMGSNAGGALISLGDTISIMNETFTITGILRPDNPLRDNFIYCEYKVIQLLYAMQGYCTLMYVFGNDEIVDNEKSLDELEQEIAVISPQIEVLSTNSLKSAAGSFFDVLKMIEGVLGIFPFVISIMFIFILMMLNLRDQTREFAILRAIGMSINKISLTIFSQIFLIACISYVGSIVVGFGFFSYSYAILTQFQLQYNSFWGFLNEMRQLIPFTVYLNTIIATLIVGIIIALIPVILWRRQNIVESFRKEV